MSGILFAICSGLHTAFNDLVFKLFTLRRSSIGLFFAIIGGCWLVTCLFTLPPLGGIAWKTNLLWGSLSGFCSATANILLIEAMVHQSAGLCSLIYRLNMVPVALGAALLLHEVPGKLNLLGIGCAILAVVIFQWGNASTAAHDSAARDSAARDTAARLAILLAVGAAVLRAAMGLLYSYAFNSAGADKNVVVCLNSLFWIVEGILYALWRERGLLHLADPRLWKYGLLSGLLVTGAVIFMALSLANGKAVIVLPISQMSFIGTFLLGVCLLKERYSWKHLLALAGGIMAVLLLSR